MKQARLKGDHWTCFLLKEIGVTIQSQKKKQHHKKKKKKAAKNPSK